MGEGRRAPRPWSADRQAPCASSAWGGSDREGRRMRGGRVVASIVALGVGCGPASGTCSAARGGTRPANGRGCRGRSRPGVPAATPCRRSPATRCGSSAGRRSPSLLTRWTTLVRTPVTLASIVPGIRRVAVGGGGAGCRDGRRRGRGRGDRRRRRGDEVESREIRDGAEGNQPGGVGHRVARLVAAFGAERVAPHPGRVLQLPDRGEEGDLVLTDGDDGVRGLGEERLPVEIEAEGPEGVEASPEADRPIRTGCRAERVPVEGREGGPAGVSHHVAHSQEGDRSKNTGNRPVVSSTVTTAPSAKASGS